MAKKYSPVPGVFALTVHLLLSRLLTALLPLPPALLPFLPAVSLALLCAVFWRAFPAPRVKKDHGSLRLLLLSLCAMLLASHTLALLFEPSVPHATSPLLPLLLRTLLLAPILEEIFFRRILLSAFAPLGTALSVLLSSLAFALCHAPLDAMLLAFLCGTVLSLVYCKTRRLSHVILLHGTVNAITLLSLAGGGYETVANAVYLAALLITALLLLLSLKKK